MESQVQLEMESQRRDITEAKVTVIMQKNSTSSDIQHNTDPGKKSFRCGTCGKTCKLKSLLKQHMRIHTDERPFSCQTCGRTFSSRGDLKKHTRIHTGEKRFIYACL